jgi:2-oxoisovalerate dehydrogenase E1 component beta subunit
LGEVPDGHFTLPLGKAAIRREGAAVTISPMAPWSMSPRPPRSRTGIDAEVIDLRTPGAARSRHDRRLRRQDRPLHRRARGDADLGLRRRAAALVQEHCFYHLEAPIMRVAGWDTPYPHAQEWDYFPGPARVGQALRDIMEAR